MKLTLRTYFIIVLSIGSLWVHAQSKNGSRLLLGKTKNVSTVKKSSPLLLQNLNKGIQLSPSRAINAYYRSVLFNTATNVAVNKETTNAKSSIGENSATTETRIALDTKSENKLFSNDKITVSSVYPNPANDFAAIDYAITGQVNEAKIVIYNVLGTSTGDYDLDKSLRTIQIQTQQMPTGVYYYQLQLDGKKVATRKLLVRH